jgi:hypothetical protein
MFLILGFYAIRIIQAIVGGHLDLYCTLMYGMDWCSLFLLGSWRFETKLDMKGLLQ